MTRDLDHFRRLCGQYRWLAVFMVASVGGLRVVANLIAPLVHWARAPTPSLGGEVAASLIWQTPALCYLFGVWSIWRGMLMIGTVTASPAWGKEHSCRQHRRSTMAPPTRP